VLAAVVVVVHPPVDMLLQLRQASVAGLPPKKWRRSEQCC
jgi:hypothetical protein